MAVCPDVFSPFDEGMVTIISKPYMNNGHCGSVRVFYDKRHLASYICATVQNTGFALLTLPHQHSCLFLGKFANLRKATDSFVMSVRPSAWNSSAPTARMFMKLRIFLKNVERIQVSLKSVKNAEHFT